LQARVALSYPASVMGETAAPVRQSWNLTRGQVVPLVLGNILALIPAMAALSLLAYGIAWILSVIFSSPALNKEVFAVPLNLVLRMVGLFSAMILMGLLSAFHARSYAYLVRSSSSISPSVS